MSSEIVFSPELPWAALAALGLAAFTLIAYSLWRGAAGWLLRGCAFAVLLIALAQPSLVREERRPLADIVFLVEDRTASQSIETRSEETAAAIAELRADLEAMSLRRDGAEPIEIREVVARDAEGPLADAGTRLLGALDEAAADAPPGRIAGAFLVTDGRAHDADRLESFPGPVHVLVSGEEGERDRRLRIVSAPSFGIVGESVAIRLAVEGLGADEGLGGVADVSMSIDGGPPRSFTAPIGTEVEITAPVDHGGVNVIELFTPESEDGLTDRNNRAVLAVNGVRDRLRVLLVSGEPHPGERTWRNLLKADPSVDLVHFTILRPPDKQDGTPVFELSLIAFPTRELFNDKLDEFDLIIFDRYRRRGVLPGLYLENIGDYVRGGGAVLFSTGEAFAGVESLHRTALAAVIPARPTARVFEEGYRPAITEKGARHPVTSGLAASTLERDENGAPLWGRWFRQIELDALSGDTIMSGVGEAPLLILDRVEDGRVAVLGSDHSWLWTRGFEGGGPQAELLRRLSHWLMKEPELEEEALTVTMQGATMTIERRSIAETPEEVRIEAPSGALTVAAFTEVGPGRWRAVAEAEEQGLHRLTDGALEAVAAVGPATPREFENPVSTTEVLAPLAAATLGGTFRLADGGAPGLRRVAEGRRAAGAAWAGVARRGAYAVEDVRLTPLAPGWAMLCLTALLMLAAWRVEGR